MVYKNVLFHYVAVVEEGIVRAQGQECWQRMCSLCGKIKVNIKKNSAVVSKCTGLKFRKLILQSIICFYFFNVFIILRFQLHGLLSVKWKVQCE